MIYQPQLLPDQPSPDQVARDKPLLTTGAVLFFPRHQQKEQAARVICASTAVRV